jgi:hypothetical protein
MEELGPLLRPELLDLSHQRRCVRCICCGAVAVAAEPATAAASLRRDSVTVLPSRKP